VLDRRIYPLIEIESISAGDNATTIKADLADLDQISEANRTASLGSIYVTVSPSDGGMIGRGELDIIRGPQAGKYSVLLDMEPPRHVNGRGPARMSQ